MKGNMRGRAALGLLALAVGLSAHGWWSQGRSTGRGAPHTEPAASTKPSPAPKATACADCHPGPAQRWKGSDHDLALQPARADTVLGDFDAQTVEHFGQRSRFFQRDAKYWVHTSDGQGVARDFRVTHVVGARPLQQYLVEGPRGRLLVLPFGWDTRPAERGGGRWFHTQPEEDIAPGHPLHWTGPLFTWNTQCAQCHSTGLEKRYNVDSDSFETRWDQIDVACEACHGSGTEHVAWAQAREPGKAYPTTRNKGLHATLPRPAQARWRFQAGRPIAVRDGPSAQDAVLAMCAECHARRAPLQTESSEVTALLAGYAPSLIQQPLYYPDGQIRDEVYVWGSFLQSKMFMAGVTCLDCHDAHSQKLRTAEPNGVCSRCHQKDHYARREHHFHKPQGPGGSCVACHMPERTYMGVDDRRDHSLRVPRPDLSLELSVPNACNGCHRDRNARWAQAAVMRWYPQGRWKSPHYGQTFALADAGDPSAIPHLLALLPNRTLPAIVRGSAARRLQVFVETDSRALPALVEATGDHEPLVRLGVATALGGLGRASLQRGIHALLRLFRDPQRAVAVEAGRSAALIRPLLPWEQRAEVDAAIQRTLRADGVQAELPLIQYKMAGLWAALEKWPEAERSYRRALAGHPTLTPAMLNLADLLRATGRDEEAGTWLERATKTAPKEPTPWVALGLWSVRNGRTKEAVGQLAKAVATPSSTAHAAYVYGVALESTGDPAGALAAWQKGLRAHPHALELHQVVVNAYRERGETAKVAQALKQLRKLYPHRPGAPPSP